MYNCRTILRVSVWRTVLSLFILGCHLFHLVHFHQCIADGIRKQKLIEYNFRPTFLADDNTAVTKYQALGLKEHMETCQSTVRGGVWGIPRVINLSKASRLLCWGWSEVLGCLLPCPVFSMALPLHAIDSQAQKKLSDSSLLICLICSCLSLQFQVLVGLGHTGCESTFFHLSLLIRSTVIPFPLTQRTFLLA